MDGSIGGEMRTGKVDELQQSNLGLILLQSAASWCSLRLPFGVSGPPILS